MWVAAPDIKRRGIEYIARNDTVNAHPIQLHCVGCRPGVGVEEDMATERSNLHLRGFVWKLVPWHIYIPDTLTPLDPTVVCDPPPLPCTSACEYHQRCALPVAQIVFTPVTKQQQIRTDLSVQRAVPRRQSCPTVVWSMVYHATCTCRLYFHYCASLAP